MDHRTIVSFFTCQLVWVNRYAVIANRRWGLWLVIGLLALFIPVLGYGVAIGLDISCGCLGRADLSSLPEAILRDLLLLTLAGALLRTSRPVFPVPKE